MKQIINGKTYNTETATELGHYWNGRSDSDFSHISESLYRTKNGQYFLAGEGGPMTRYSRPVGDMTGGGKGIIPLSESEAREWMERYCDADEYIAAFGEPEEA